MAVELACKEVTENNGGELKNYDPQTVATSLAQVKKDYALAVNMMSVVQKTRR